MAAHLRFATIAALVIGSLLWAQLASAQSIRSEKFRVQLHVAAEERIKSEITSYLSLGLQGVNDVVLTNEDADYVLSVVAMPMTAGGYAVSLAVMNIYNARALDNLSALWQLPAASRDKFKATLKGAGALVDQRAQAGPDLKTLCSSIVTSFDADTLGTARKFR